MLARRPEGGPPSPRTPSRVEHRRQILKLTPHRVRPRVPAAATTPARIVEYGELVRQRRHEHRVLRTIIESAADQYHRWPEALALIGDLRPIGGRHRPHGALLGQQTTGVGKPHRRPD